MRVEQSSLKPRQRIFQREYKRISVRLEEEFWQQLESSASEDGQKLADLIFELARGPENSASRSSLLRTYCLRWLREKLVQARLTASEIDLQTILSACATPCVVISSTKKLIAHNRAFSERILSSLVAPDQWDEATNLIRFSLSKPINKIMEAVKASETGYAEAQVAFVRDSNVIRLTGRFCLMNARAQESSPLLCFLLHNPRRG